MIVKLIAAHDKQMGIGYDNDLLWGPGSQKADMKRFRDLTQGHPVIMGRKTWESIRPKYRPLYGRSDIVLSREEDYMKAALEEKPAEQAYFLGSLEQALNLCKYLHNGPINLSDRMARDAYDFSSVWIIGGASIYKEALTEGLVDEMFLTKIRTSFNEVDAVLYQNNDFLLKSMDRFPADDSNH